jgi:hypothetical protein
MPPPADGELFQEQGRPEIYLIRDGERLWIPNPYVMEALSLDWNAVQTGRERRGLRPQCCIFVSEEVQLLVCPNNLFSLTESLAFASGLQACAPG